MENGEQKFQFIVPESQSKIRLDKFLTEKLKRISRSRLQVLIAEAYITVNGNPTKASHLILPHEKIEVVIPKSRESEILPEDIPLKIVYEDRHLLVVNKDAGMVTHPAFGNLTGTLVNALMYHCQGLSSVGDVKRPGIVHRLDKDTSGLLVVAKDDYTHQRLSSQFSKRTIERQYQAVVWGHFHQLSGSIESHLARSIKDRTKIVTATRGKKAVTNYQVIKQYPLVSLVSLRLETGRTHQIRVHLSFKGHPVLGDKTYGGIRKQINSLNQKDKLLALKLLQIMPRQALHAKTLGFLHPIKNEFLRFDSELPSDMQNLVNYLQELTKPSYQSNFQ